MLFAGNSQVTSIRAVTITMQPMLRDLITELIAGHTDVDVIAELDTREAIGQPLQSLAPELVLIGLGKGEGDEIGPLLLGLLPDAKVIAFSSDGRHAFVHRLHRPRTVLPDISPQQLIDTVLGA
jgi:DNA-binding NarL/FixJ family response regulator